MRLATNSKTTGQLESGSIRLISTLPCACRATLTRPRLWRMPTLRAASRRLATRAFRPASMAHVRNRVPEVSWVEASLRLALNPFGVLHQSKVQQLRRLISMYGAHPPPSRWRVHCGAVRGLAGRAIQRHLRVSTSFAQLGQPNASYTAGHGCACPPTVPAASRAAGKAGSCVYSRRPGPVLIWFTPAGCTLTPMPALLCM